MQARPHKPYSISTSLDRIKQGGASPPVTAADLSAMTLGELEQVWSLYPCAPLPGGVWEAKVVADFPMSLGKKLLSYALFKRRVFGLDLDKREWWFDSATRTMVQFEPKPGPSRWRDADVIQLHYENTGPRLFRQMLYDELKPLNDTTILGIGGSNTDGAAGTWFFFVMTPVPVL